MASIVSSEHKPLQTQRGTRKNSSNTVLLEQWAQERDLSEKTLAALCAVMDSLKSRIQFQNSYHDPRMDDFLCNLVLENYADPEFTRCLQAALPVGLSVYFSSVKTSEVKMSEAIAVVTPTRQCLWVIRSAIPQPKLLYPYRPSLEGLLNGMSDREILDELGDNSALGLCAMDVFQWGIDWIPTQRDRTRCFSILRKLAKAYQSVPPSLRITDIEVDPRPFGGGGYSDVYRGVFRENEVCVKVLRLFLTGSHRRKVIKHFSRETLLWRQLQHPNILPFLGFNEEIFAPSFSLVSPLMENGNILTYLKCNPRFDRVKGLIDIAEGISYLHEYHTPIIHGDIRGANILVKNNLECCLGDLGLSLIAESGQSVTSSSTTRGGAVRWMAPELLDSQFSLPDPDRRKRDIYAFGCTALEICTNEAPFTNQSIDYMVCLDVTQGRRPPKPSEEQISDWLWSLIELCWQAAPLDRPSIGLVLNHLKARYSGIPDNQLIHGGDSDLDERSNPRASPRLPFSDSVFDSAEIIFSSDISNMYEWSRRTNLDIASADRINANYARAHRWLNSLKEILIWQYEWKEARNSDSQTLFSLDTRRPPSSSVGFSVGTEFRLSLPYDAAAFLSRDRGIQWKTMFHSDIFRTLRNVSPPINDLLNLLQCLLPGVLTIVYEEFFEDGIHLTSRGLPPIAWVTQYGEDLVDIFGVLDYETLRAASADQNKAWKLDVVPHFV